MIDRPDVPDIDWARNIAELDDVEMKSRLSGLPVAAQTDIFLALDWKQRVRIIRNSEQAAEIVRSLPEQEVLLTIKGAGIEDSLPLIVLTTPEQLRFVLDVEVWARDTVDAPKARLWLNYILSCGEHKVIEFVQSVDRELLVVMLADLITLVPNEEGLKVPEELPGIMPDEFFTILSNEPQETENLRLLLRVIRQWDRDEFYKLLFQVHGSVDAETEEIAFRWRTSRLEEKGLLELEEALEIYGYIGEDEARNIAQSADAIPPGDASGIGGATYPILLTDRRGFFYRVLTSIADLPLRNRLRAEITFAANRLLAVDARSVGEIDAMKAALNRLFALVNVGLLFLSGGDDREATGILQTVPVKELFQIGFSRASDLRAAARGFAARWWPKWQEKGFTYLGYPHDEIMRGLLRRVPQIYSLPEGGKIDFRDFETMDEIVRIRQALDEIAVVAEACFDKLGVPAAHEAEPELETVLAGGIEEITFRNIILTGFVNFVVEGAFRIRPLTHRDIHGLFEQAIERPSPGGILVAEDAKEAFLSWLVDTVGFGEGKWKILRAFIEESMRVLEQEIGKVPSWEILDPRYVGTLIFSTSYGQDRGSVP